MINLRYWTYALVIFAAATILSYQFLDKPLALLAHDQLRHYLIFSQLTTLTEYFPPIAIAVIFALGLWRLAGRTLGYSLEAFLLSSVSLVVARAAKDQLKYVFGRTWPETWTNNNTSLIKDGAFGFNPFHGGAGFESFPSGHTLGICAVITALWFYYPRYAPIYVILILSVSIGLIGANYHFLSDIIAGGFIGATLAVLCEALCAEIGGTREFAGQTVTGGVVDVVRERLLLTSDSHTVGEVISEPCCGTCTFDRHHAASHPLIDEQEGRHRSFPSNLH